MNEEITTKEETKVAKAVIPEFRAGDTVRVMYRIVEGEKTREQPYEGIVIARNGKGISKSFTVRKIGADSIGVERIIPLFSPNLISLSVLKRGKVRRAKLYYLRGKVGKAATRIKEIVEPKVKKTPKAE